MSAVVKDIGFTILKKPVVIVGTVVVIGGVVYYFFKDTVLGDMFGLMYEGLNYLLIGVTESLKFLFDGDTWTSAGDFFKNDVGGFFKDDVGGFFKDDIGGGIKDAGNSIKDAFKF